VLRDVRDVAPIESTCHDGTLKAELLHRVRHFAIISAQICRTTWAGAADIIVVAQDEVCWRFTPNLTGEDRTTVEETRRR
jgi:hypothetical protein